MLSRKHVKAIRRNRAAQLEAERLREEARQRMINSKAKVIYRMLRRRIIWRKIWRRAAATTIQKRFRGRQGRKLTAAMIADLALRRLSAWKIQCAYRQRLGRRRVLLMQKLEYVRQWMVNIAAAEEEKRRLIRINGAASLIAFTYRAYVIRKKLKKMIYWHHMDLAVYLQKRYRGFIQVSWDLLGLSVGWGRVG